MGLSAETVLEDSPEIGAEIKLPLYKDWQHIIELWYKSTIGARFKDVMCNPTTTRLRFGATARANDSSWSLSAFDQVHYQVNAATTASDLDNIDLAIVQSIVFSIGSITGWYNGFAMPYPDMVFDGGQAKELNKVLQNILQAFVTIQNLGGSRYRTSSNKNQNYLEIDRDKVIHDLSCDGTGSRAFTFTTYTSIPMNMSIDTDRHVLDTVAGGPLTTNSTNNALAITAISNLWPNVNDTSLTNSQLINNLGNGAKDVPAFLGTDRGHTTVLSQLLNAESFLPVINRLIAGGLFFVDKPDGSSDYTGTNLTDYEKSDQRKFNPCRQYKTTNYFDSANTSSLANPLHGDTPKTNDTASNGNIPGVPNGTPADLAFNTRDDRVVASDSVEPWLPYHSEIHIPVQVLVSDINAYNDTTGLDQLDYFKFLERGTGDGGGRDFKSRIADGAANAENDSIGNYTTTPAHLADPSVPDNTTILSHVATVDTDILYPAMQINNQARTSSGPGTSTLVGSTNKVNNVAFNMSIIFRVPGDLDAQLSYVN